MEEIYDLVVLGAGPAGMTAAIYAGRYNLKTLVVGKSVGGTVNLAGEIENWPGFIGSGMELMGNIRNQVEKFGAEILEADVKSVEKEDGLFVLNVDDKIIKGKSLIVALGTEHRQLNIPGEKEFLGKGVSYCATCDGNFFRGKSVAVVGGADSAAKAALYLSDICEKVYVIYRKHEMRCEPVSLSKICSKENISIKYFSNPTEVLGESVVRGLKIKTDDPDKGESDEVIDVDGVFIEVGATPAAEVVKGLGLEMENGYIKVDRKGRTSVDGVFGAGDVTNGPMKQVVTAAGEGAIAAKMAHEFVLGK
jgi:thioredoxin reductase (NADPH)